MSRRGGSGPSRPGREPAAGRQRAGSAPVRGGGRRPEPAVASSRPRPVARRPGRRFLIGHSSILLAAAAVFAVFRRSAPYAELDRPVCPYIFYASGRKYSYIRLRAAGNRRASGRTPPSTPLTRGKDNGGTSLSCLTFYLPLFRGGGQVGVRWGRRALRNRRTSGLDRRIYREQNWQCQGKIRSFRKYFYMPRFRAAVTPAPPEHPRRRSAPGRGGAACGASPGRPATRPSAPRHRPNGGARRCSRRRW